MFHVISDSAALQTAFFYAQKSSLLFKVGIGKSLFIDFALLMTLFNVVTIVSPGLLLKPFSDVTK